ncbi:MAG: chromosome partitioning protein [Treponema sp.]|jgi:phage shock protein A|nr:chromosome partitioning protein [Treponema sp.]
MDRKPDDLTGMDAAGAREYIFHFISTLKLTEKRQEELARESEKWNSRLELARSGGTADLVSEAEKAAVRIRTEADKTAAEIRELKNQIEAMRRQLPGLAARQRSINPDLLEQELLIAAGHNPRDEKQAAARKLEDLEKETNAGAALEALKAKMSRSGSSGEDGVR